MLKKSKTSYYNHFNDKSQVYPRLDIQICNIKNHYNKGRLLIELGENRYMSKDNAIKFFKWVIEELESIPDNDIYNPTIDTARKFAINAHKDQIYGNNKPYIYHLDKVAEILEPYGDTAVIIGYLHDVIENTDKTKDDIRKVFGKFISECVEKLTDPLGFTRIIRKKLKNIELSRIKDEYDIILIVKAADRLANLEEDGKIDMYLREHKEFREAVYRPGLCDDIWSRIEEIIENAKK